MPLSFAAITPHSPLLIPSIGKNNLSRLEKTNNSYKKIGRFLAEENIETLVIISPHGGPNEKKIALNASPKISVNFEEFGDFSSKTETETDLETAEAIRLSLLESNSVIAINKVVPDFGSGVPAYLLLKEFKKLEVVLVNTSLLDENEHFKIGTAIGKSLEESGKRIAVTASADLSHCLDKKSPAGYSPKGQKFDLRLLDLIREKRIDDLIGLDEKIIDEAKTCGLKPIMTLFGALSGAGADWEMVTSTYEAPFGIGYLTASLKIK